MSEWIEYLHAWSHDILNSYVLGAISVHIASFFSPKLVVTPSSNRHFRYMWMPWLSYHM